ncbi:unnamed protein product [Effrenium voratum]|nr:unnamed protein product [Effrenium voratum]
MSDLMEQAQAVLTNFSAELLLFGGAFLLQFFLFGNVLWPWKKRGKGKAKKIDSSPSSQEIENILEATHAAFEQGDHRTVLRKWGTLQRAGDVPAETLVQVVESMQRLRKDRSFILAEVKGLVLKSDAAQSVDYMNDLLTPLTKSLDAGLITNLLTVFSKVGVEANSRTYEILMHLHFATRSFEEVKDLAKQMRQIGLHATQRTTLVMLKTFLQEGCLSDALQCYCELPCDLPKHVGTQLVEIACRERRMEEVLPKLETGRIPMTTDSLNLMLNESLRSAQPELAKKAGKKNDIDSVLSLLEGPAKLPGTAWNIALDTCVENGELEKAKQLAKRMKDAGVMDVVSYNTLIKAYVRHNLFDQASALLLTMRQDPAAMPNTVTYHELISGLLKTGKEINRTRAWELVNEMKEDDVLPNKPMVSNLLRSLRPKSHSSEINRAMQLVDSIQHQVDEGLLCTVLEAGVRVGKAQVLLKKLKTFHGDQAEFPVKITGAHSFGSLIKAYGFVKDVAGAWNCWKEMSVQHLKPTNITLGCLVEAVASNGDVDGAHELIQRLLEDPETKSQVNAVIYGSILKGFSRKKRMDRVWDAFEEMKKHGIAPTLMTFNAILDGCVRNEEMSKVPELLSRMQSVGLEPNLITYSTMIKGFCNTGDMQSAFSIFEKLQKGPEVPDEVVYNTLLDGCLQAGLADEGEQLLEAMMAQGLAPSIYTLSVLVKLLASAKRLDKAFKMAENASVRFRFRLGAQLQSALLQACISCRAYERGARFYLKTHKDRLSADKKICQTIIRGLLTTGKAELAAELLRSLLGLHSSEEVLQHRATQDVDEALAVEVLEALGSRDAWHLYESLKAAKPQFTVGPELLKRMTASKGHNKCR